MRPPPLPRRALLAAAALLTQAPPAPARAWCGEQFPSWAFYLKWDQAAAGGTNYRIVGDRARESKTGVPPILVVGAPGIGYEYLENFEALTVSDRRVIFASVAGTAPAQAFDPSLATPEAVAAQLDGVCKTLGVPVVHVIAHGLGAPAALRLAAASNAATSVRSLTLISPYGSAADLRPGALDLASVKSMPQLENMLLPTVSSNARDSCIAEARAAGGGPILLPTLAGSAPGTALGGAALGERLTALGSSSGNPPPVLLATGGARDLVDPDAWTGVPSSVTRKTFANSGHLPFVEERDTLLFACVEFLDAADGKATNREFKFADPLETIKEIRGG